MSKIPDNIESLRILTYPDPRLREPARPVGDPTDPALAGLVEKMRELMVGDDGVGIAATQLGVPVRVFIARPSREPLVEYVAVNPEIVETEGWQESKEGCLSLPGISLTLKRHQRVKLRFQDLAGQTNTVDASGFLATIFQHEGDHLDGRMIIDRAGMVGRLAIRDALRQLEDEFQPARR